MKRVIRSNSYKSKYDREISEMMDFLVDLDICTNDELSLVCAINGTNMDTLNKILRVRTGYSSAEALGLVLHSEDEEY